MPETRTEDCYVKLRFDKDLRLLTPRLTFNAHCQTVYSERQLCPQPEPGDEQQADDRLGIHDLSTRDHRQRLR
jgi:hypothetical protein